MFLRCQRLAIAGRNLKRRRPRPPLNPLLSEISPATRRDEQREKDMDRFKIVDTGPAFTWCRETFIEASDRDAAQEAYIDQCEAAGIAHGSLNVLRTR
ncbi:hypothetical protein L519_2157 [Bordetella bronchiseptica MBORD678]|nr:hypothetical protein L519_2157 [Bordetella bronchiseptica MBORD678]